MSALSSLDGVPLTICCRRERWLMVTGRLFMTTMPAAPFVMNLVFRVVQSSRGMLQRES